jgi:hypothetical protein
MRINHDSVYRARPTPPTSCEIAAAVRSIFSPVARGRLCLPDDLRRRRASKNEQPLAPYHWTPPRLLGLRARGPRAEALRYFTFGRSRGRCFVATLVFGEAPETRVLRRFRDRVMRPRPLGRRLIALYYRCAPRLCRFLKRRLHLRRAVRRICVGWSCLRLGGLIGRRSGMIGSALAVGLLAVIGLVVGSFWSKRHCYLGCALHRQTADEFPEEPTMTCRAALDDSKPLLRETSKWQI